MLSLYGFCKSIATKQNIGDEQKDGRWWSFQDLSKAYFKHRALDCMILMHHGQLKRWWVGFDDSPLNSVHQAYAPTRFEDDDAAPGFEAGGGNAADPAAGGEGAQPQGGDEVGPTSHRQSVETARKEASNARKGQQTLNYVCKRLLGDILSLG